jgi:methylthioribulose-1-phosphate dehydratase
MAAMTLALAIEKTDIVEEAAETVIAAGRAASSRHWVPATSGNFSARIDAARIAITRSGVDKGALTRADILIQDLDAPLRPGSSAEAALHVRLYRDNPDIRAIFHTHGPASSVIGQAHAARKSVRIRGWELQKALAGITTHEATVDVPVFANDQNVDALAERVAKRLARPVPKGCSRAPGYLLAGHGLYAWGRTAAEATRHLEAFEVLFSQMLALRSYKP